MPHIHWKATKATWAGSRARLLPVFLSAAALCLVPAAHAQYTAPYVILQGTLSSSSGLPAKNATLTLAPSQVFFVAGTQVVVSESQCATDANGSVVSIGNPGPPRVSAQFVGTLPAGNYYVKFTWYDQFGAQTLPSPEVAQQLTAAGELQILPPVGSGPPQAMGMDVYIGAAPGAETFQGETVSPTAQFTQDTSLGQTVTGITITSGGQFAACPANYTFTGGGGTGAAANAQCTGTSGNFTLSGVAALMGGYGYTSAPAVSTSGTPITPPVLAATLGPTAAPPIANSTSCRVVANDAGWPTGTGYNVSLVDSNGNTLFNYPEMWQFFGPGSAYNLSQGIPYYHGQVTYPVPVLTVPYNHNVQSISGPLNMTDYSVVNVAQLGVGTALPGWGIDVEGASTLGEINGEGYLLNGTPPSGTVCLGSTDGIALDAYVPCFTGTAHYQTIASNSATTYPQRAILNFNAPILVEDATSGLGQITTVFLDTVGPGTLVPEVTGLAGTGGEAVMANAPGGTGNCMQWGAAGATDSGSPCAGPTSGSNTNGYWVKDAGGHIHEWGQITGSGSVSTGTTVTFPLAFVTASSISVNATSITIFGHGIGFISIESGTVGTSGFTVEVGAESTTDGLYWVADGY